MKVASFNLHRNLVFEFERRRIVLRRVPTKLGECHNQMRSPRDTNCSHRVIVP